MKRTDCNITIIRLPLQMFDRSISLYLLTLIPPPPVGKSVFSLFNPWNLIDNSPVCCSLLYLLLSLVLPAFSFAFLLWFGLVRERAELVGLLQRASAVGGESFQGGYVVVFWEDGDRDFVEFVRFVHVVLALELLLVFVGDDFEFRVADEVFLFEAAA